VQEEVEEREKEAAAGLEAPQRVVKRSCQRGPWCECAACCLPQGREEEKKWKRRSGEVFNLLFLHDLI